MLFRQIIQYSLYAGIATICHYALLLATVELFDWNPVPATALGAAVGALVHYMLNKRYTFADRQPHTRTLPRHVAVAASAWFLNVSLMWVWVSVLVLHYLPGQLLITGLVLGFTFLASRYYTFAARK